LPRWYCCLDHDLAFGSLSGATASTVAGRSDSTGPLHKPFLHRHIPSPPEMDLRDISWAAKMGRRGSITGTIRLSSSVSGPRERCTTCFDILSGPKARDFRLERRERLAPPTRWALVAGEMMASLTSQAIRAVPAHPMEASIVSCPSARRIPRAKNTIHLAHDMREPGRRGAPPPEAASFPPNVARAGQGAARRASRRCHPGAVPQ